MKDINSLAYTKCNCKYYIVFVPKYRRYLHRIIKCKKCYIFNYYSMRFNIS